MRLQMPQQVKQQYPRLHLAFRAAWVGDNTAVLGEPCTQLNDLAKIFR